MSEHGDWRDAAGLFPLRAGEESGTATLRRLRDNWIDDARDQEATIAALRDALAVYADPASWDRLIRVGDRRTTYAWAANDDPGWALARVTLAALDTAEAAQEGAGRAAPTEEGQ